MMDTFLVHSTKLNQESPWVHVDIPSLFSPSGSGIWSMSEPFNCSVDLENF